MAGDDSPTTSETPFGGATGLAKITFKRSRVDDAGSGGEQKRKRTVDASETEATGKMKVSLGSNLEEARELIIEEIDFVLAPFGRNLNSQTTLSSLLPALRTCGLPFPVTAQPANTSTPHSDSESKRVLDLFERRNSPECIVYQDDLDEAQMQWFVAFLRDRYVDPIYLNATLQTLRSDIKVWMPLRHLLSLLGRPNPVTQDTQQEFHAEHTIAQVHRAARAFFDLLALVKRADHEVLSSSYSKLAIHDTTPDFLFTDSYCRAVRAGEAQRKPPGVPNLRRDLLQLPERVRELELDIGPGGVTLNDLAGAQQAGGGPIREVHKDASIIAKNLNSMLFDTSGCCFSGYYCDSQQGFSTFVQPVWPKSNSPENEQEWPTSRQRPPLLRNVDAYILVIGRTTLHPTAPHFLSFCFSLLPPHFTLPLIVKGQAESPKLKDIAKNAVVPFLLEPATEEELSRWVTLFRPLQNIVPDPDDPSTEEDDDPHDNPPGGRRDDPPSGSEAAGGSSSTSRSVQGKDTRGSSGQQGGQGGGSGRGASDPKGGERYTLQCSPGCFSGGAGVRYRQTDAPPLEQVLSFEAAEGTRILSRMFIPSPPPSPPQDTRSDVHQRALPLVLLGPVGKGLSSVVYHATTSDSAIQALKYSKGDDAADKEIIHEVEIYAEIGRLAPQIAPRCFGLFLERDETKVLVLEKFGESVKSLEELSKDERLLVYRRLRKLHLTVGYSHGDFAERNILLEKATRNIKLIDFGRSEKHECSGKSCPELQGARRWLLGL